MLRINGNPVEVDVAPETPLLMGAPRHARPAGHEVRLRARALRRLHRAHRRRARAVVPDACQRRRRLRGDDDRRLVGRQQSSRAAGMAGARRAAMRLLSVGPDHVRGRARRGQSRAERRRHRRRDGRQHLPLRYLRSNPRGHQASGRARGRAEHEHATRVSDDLGGRRRRLADRAATAGLRAAARGCGARPCRPRPCSRTRGCASAPTAASRSCPTNRRWGRACTRRCRR